MEVMRTTLALGLCLFAVTAIANAQPRNGSESDIASPSLREVYRARLNENVVTIMAGTPNGTGLNIASDIAAVIDDGDRLRVVPMVGRGVKDGLFLRGVDMGITHTNILKHFADTGELGSNLVGQLTYVTKLFNDEVHILVPAEVTDIHQLNGRVVNFGEEGSGADITARLILNALGIEVEAVHFGDADAVLKLKSGEIAAAIMLAGKPAPMIANLGDVTGLRLLPISYTKELENDYYPATLTHEDYPELIVEGESVDTVAVCAVLVAFNSSENNVRARRVVKFVDAFFSKFEAFHRPPRHPKWREVNFAATLEGWNRSPIAQAWIERAKQGTDTASQSNFDAFLTQTAQAGGGPTSEAERAQLFRAFLAWSKKQGAAETP
jgi:TRAP transporter TAXI family solute receptor